MTNRTIFAVRVAAGAPRTLFSVIEKENGELFLIPKAAERAEIGGPLIQEQRFSIHLSSKSADYNTVKQTLRTSDGKTETSVMLTDAVKLRNGFSVLFVRRAQDLRDTRYNPKEAEADRVHVLADYDPAFYSLYFGVFVGHPDTDFDTRTGGVAVSQFHFKLFKIIVLTSLDGWPSHFSSHVATAITFAPGIVDDVPAKDMLRHHMGGKSSQICLHQYINSVKTLIKLYWEAVLPELDDPDLIALAQAEIAKVSDVELVELNLGGAAVSTHVLSGGPPPKLQ